MNKPSTLVIIDSQALIHRAFHALPILTDRRGTPTNAVFGFFSVFLRMIKEISPTAVVACFDLPAPTFRHAAFADYKAHRPKTPSELIVQIPIVKELLGDFKVPVVELAGYEADDLVGTIATLVAREHKDWQVIIATGDLDTLQLITPRIEVYTLKKGVNETNIYNEAAVLKRYGLAPATMREYKGLVGDPSDNIPGVKGIGEKGAIALLKEYKDLESIYKALEDAPEKFKARLKNALTAGRESAFFSRTLATIDCKAPIKFDLKTALRADFDLKAATLGLQKYGLRSLIARLPHKTTGTLLEPAAPPTRKKISVLKVKQWPNFDLAVVAVGWHENSLACFHKDKWLVGPLDLGALPERLVIHDYKKLVHLIMRHGQRPAPAHFDTLLAAWLSRPGRTSYEPTKLAEVLNIAPPEFEGRLDDNELAALTEGYYALEFYKHLKPIIEKQKLTSVLNDLEQPLTLVLAEMEAAGIVFDSHYLKSLKLEVKTQLKSLTKAIHQAAGTDFNILSPKQIRETLFEKLKISTIGIRTTPTGALSTDEQELRKIMAANPIVVDILAYRERAKLLNTYIEPLPRFADESGRIHTTFIQTGAVTGRLASAEPNLQNIPLRTELGRRVRHAFVAPPRAVFLAFDFSQIDLRVVAHLSGDKTMIDAFLRQEDIHVTTAAAVLNLEPTQITKVMRQNAKAVNFGIIYGLSAFGLSESTDMTREEAKQFINGYFERFKGVKDFMEKTKDQVRQQGYAETILGRRRYLPEIKSGSFRARSAAEREAINHPVQGTTADIMKKAMLDIAQIISRRFPNDVKMLLQVHDDLLFEVNKDAVVRVIPVIKKAMEEVVALAVPLQVEVKAGENWGEMSAIN